MSDLPSGYQHLLVALDFSPDNAQIIGRAQALAQAFSARISLVHVVEYIPLDLANDLMLAQPIEVDEQMLDEARQQLQELAQTHGLADAPIHCLNGSTKAEILQLAQQQGADLIVVGSHGRHGLALLLGSTANAVLHGASCDVLAVRVPERPLDASEQEPKE